MNGEPFFDFWRGGKAVFFFFQKIYFRMAGHFLISRGAEDMKFAHERTCSKCLKMHLSSWGPARVFFWILEGLKGHFLGLMSLNRYFSYYQPAILSRDTGQRISCFDRCHLTITWMSDIKEVRYKAKIHVSVNLLAGVQAPCCATSSSSCARAHEQRRQLFLPVRKAIYGFL